MRPMPPSFTKRLQAPATRTDAGLLPALQEMVRRLFLSAAPQRTAGRRAASSTTSINSGSWARDFAFTQAVGRAFRDIYPEIVRRNMAATPGRRKNAASS